MILHCTKKLSAKLANVQTEPQTETSPLGSWHGHLYVFDRRQCVLFVHDETRYSVFIPGLVKSHFKHIDKCFKEAFLASLVRIGVPDNQIARANLALGKMMFDSCTDRSVLGSMKNLSFMIHSRVEEVPNVMDIDILELNYWLTGMLMGNKDRPDYGRPQKEMSALVAAL